MESQNPKKIQHFIPRFILKRFISSNGKFKFVDKRYGASLKPPSGAMYHDYFYEHDDFDPNEIEDLLSVRENIYAPIIEKLINKIPLTLEEHKILLEFRHVTYYRSNEFIGFHNHQKSRDADDWMQRWDWRSLNGIFQSNDYEADIKKSQLKSIKLVVDGKDEAHYISSLTPVCFVFTTKGKKFMVSDSGSLRWGDDFDGAVIIVLSPSHAVMFPRLKQALDIMTKLGVTNQTSTVRYEDADDELVKIVNDRVIKSSFEYYIDPN